MSRIVTLLLTILVSSFLIPRKAWSAMLVVRSVEVHCGDSAACVRQKVSYKALSGDYRNITHLRQTLRVLVARGGVRDFVWWLVPEEEGERLVVSYVPKELITSVKVKGAGNLQDYIEKGTRIKVNQWLDPNLFADEETMLTQGLSSKGYPGAQVNIQYHAKNGEAELEIKVSPGVPQLLRGLHINTDSKVVRRLAELKMREILRQPFDMQIARAKADELEADLFNFGYYLATVSLKPKVVSGNIELDITVGPVELFVFDLRQQHEDVKPEYGQLVKELFRRYRRPLDASALKAGIEETLRKRAYLSPQITVLEKHYRNSDGDQVNAFKIEMDPGARTRVRSVSFNGAQFWDQKKLMSMWNDQAQELAKAGFYDEDSNTAFAEWLRDQYIGEGFVRAHVAPPQVVFVDPLNAKLEYQVVEGARVQVESIIFEGVTDDETASLAEEMKTKEGEPFNPHQFVDDVRLVANRLQEQGWYDAEVKNRDADDIVVYGQDKTSVRLHLKIYKGKRMLFNRLVIAGNRKTLSRVIRRKSSFEKGTPLTPGKVKEFENLLSSLGLFSSVRVRPIRHKGTTALTDLAVEVVERDYGSIELAPGFRTDIGLKLSGTISYLNILGANRSISLTGQVNRRVNTQTLDTRRPQSRIPMIEYNLGSNYNQPDLFDTYVNYGAGLNFQRRRFFSFDADVLRLSNTLTRDFGQRYSFSLRHQYERINQFASTEIDGEPDNNGQFTIGALTPSFTADFRNTRINPTAGAWFNVSNEYANPYFLSQKNPDLTIDFYKFVSRNRFYIPIPRGTVAISLVGGIQENLDRKRRADGTTEGYIPNIKLFRITGTDIVRGFTDQEINRLPNGRDIGDDRVQNRAYMAVLKVEPRYFINDGLMTGVFFDAGRVYVDQFHMGELRQSVGVTFKVVTPVGTLDFDYGVKLLRKREPDGNLESPGRFHVSIGFF